VAGVTDATTCRIERAALQDAVRVAALGARLFAQAYGPTHPEPELGRYLARAFAVPRLAAELADPDVVFFVARDAEGEDVGYAIVRRTREMPPEGVRGTRPFEIVRFYVDAAWHGRGLAQALMRTCVDTAREQGGDVLWLQVWMEAARPQAFYRREGFEPVGRTTFAFGDRLEDDVVLARELES
jgi:GNAT superfamily N-acetyltransferase